MAPFSTALAGCGGSGEGVGQLKGSLKELGNQLAQSFQKLSPAHQEQMRKAMYESVTKKPFREKP